MYCIIGMPRTGTTSAYYWINHSLTHTEHRTGPYRRHGDNGEFFTGLPEDQTIPTYFRLIKQQPLPIVKILAFSYAAIDLFLASGLYTTITILPNNLRTTILRNEIAGQCKDWSGKQSLREERRAPFKGKVVITEDAIRNYWKMFVRLSFVANKTKYSFKEAEVLAEPNKNFLHHLGLPYVRGNELTGVYEPHTMDDWEMLADREEFIALCDKVGI